MDKNDWIILPRDFALEKPEAIHAKLLEMMSLLEEDGGFRFTDEQAEVIRTIIESLIDQIKSLKHQKKDRKIKFTFRLPFNSLRK